MRKNLAPAFSDKALKEQEPLVQRLVDLLIIRLHEQVEENQPTVDIMRWYNYTTFDIITDLIFGEPLYCLRDKDYHPWVTAIFASLKISSIMARARQFAAFAYIDMILGLFIDRKALEKKRVDFYKMVSAKVSKRLDEGTQRPDFISLILKNEEKDELSSNKNEMDSNAFILMLAGSETTATVLSGFTYLLLSNQQIYKKLVEEIRGKFKRGADITFEEVNKLDYLVAALQEAMRYYPAVPTGFPRVVPPGGDIVSGVYVSEGVSFLCSYQSSALH
jgi:cytochrome P450